MTVPWVVALSVLALVVALAAAWYARPRQPDLDPERWFKVMLSTLLRGEEEAGEGSAARWEARVLRFVPYHPAGRLPERKVARPVSFDLPGPALEGEVALLEALAREPDPAARWERMYDRDEVAVEARLSDPFDLGTAYDPARLLGPGGGWEHLAAWGGGDSDYARVLADAHPATWVVVRGAERQVPPVLDALEQVLAHPVVRVPYQPDPEALADAAGRAASSAAPAPGDRVVLVGEGEGAHAVLRALAADAGLRDRTSAVLAVGGVLGGLPGDPGPWGEEPVGDWMAAWFGHRALDTEARRTTPYLAVQWLDRRAEPPGFPGLPLAGSRFPEPADEGGLDRYLEPVDLGPLPADPDLPAAQVARALAAVVTCLVLVHR